MKKLIMTVGLPRSGKSTWARKQGHPIVSPDAIRLALHGKPFIQSAEPFVWAIAHTMVDALFEAGHNTVILDACNNTVRRRNEWRNGNWEAEFVCIMTDKENCLQNLGESGYPPEQHSQIKESILRMARMHEPVSKKEGPFILVGPPGSG